MEENYAVSNFGKPLTEISLDDLNHFFSTEQEESDTLEFKSYAADRGQNDHGPKEAGVLRTICAFLNSSGGLVVWGAPEGHKPEGRKNKIFTGALSPVTRLIEKDTFISRVANSIVPLSSLIKMHRVKAGQDNYIYLFEVGQSLYRPHQFDNRYWVRSDGQTNIAPHYLIDALFKQIRYPNLGGYIKFAKTSYISRNIIELNFRVYILNHSRSQNEYDPYFKLTTAFGRFMNDPGEIGELEYESHVFSQDNILKIMSYSHAPSKRVSLRIVFSDFEHRPVELTLMFGGKLSPMKRSDYKLTFRGLGDGGLIRSVPIENMFEIASELNGSMVYDDLTEDERVRLFLEQ